MRKTLVLLIGALLAVAACSAYRPGPLPPVALETMMVSKAEKGLTVAADPYAQVERQQSVFDANFKELNVLPVRVVVENTGDDRLLVRYSDMRLELGGGDQLSPAGTTAVATRIENTSQQFWSTFCFGLPGAFATSSSYDKSRSERQADYQAKQFHDITLSKDESANGFVYFILRKESAYPSSAILIVNYVERDTGAGGAIRISLDLMK